MPAERPRAVAAAGGLVWRPAAGGGGGGAGGGRRPRGGGAARGLVGGPAAGGGGVETVVVHRPRYDDWSLPKGKLDAGENALTAAVREVCEETGLQVVAGRRSVRTHYAVAAGAKHVDSWLMQAGGGAACEPNDEVDELRWLPVAEATALVTHHHDRAVLADLAREHGPRAPAPPAGR